MQVKIAAIIPTFNHYLEIDSIIKACLSEDIFPIIINDGSASKVSDKLKEITIKYGNSIHYGEHIENKGKGQAFLTGLEIAYNLKIHSSLQIDADAQHDLNYIKNLKELAILNPDSLILGYPLYDQSVPKIRLHSRKIANNIVNLLVRPLKISDTMCGFRSYPVERTLNILKDHQINYRMGFDIEIILYFARKYQNSIINFLVPVIYRKNNISNYKFFKDTYEIGKILYKHLLTKYYVRMAS